MNKINKSVVNEIEFITNKTRLRAFKLMKREGYSGVLV